MLRKISMMFLTLYSQKLSKAEVLWQAFAEPSGWYGKLYMTLPSTPSGDLKMNGENMSILL